MNRLTRFLILGALTGLLILLGTKIWIPTKSSTSASTAAPASADHSSLASAVAVPPPLSPALRPTESSVSLTEQIARALRAGSDQERDRVYRELLPRLIAQDSSAAAALAESWERGEQRLELLREVARQWSDRDIAAALTWLAALESGAARASAADVVVRQVGRTDAAGALEIGHTLQSGTNDGSLEHRLQLWTEESPADAVAWVRARPAGAQRDRLLARAAYVRVQSNPVEAMDLLQLMSEGPANAEATDTVIRLWQSRDPAAATAWLAQNPR